MEHTEENRTVMKEGKFRLLQIAEIHGERPKKERNGVCEVEKLTYVDNADAINSYLSRTRVWELCSAMMENGGEEKDWRVGSGDECFLLTS